MSDNSKIIEAFNKELSNLKDQKEEYLLEYGAKVKVLDAKNRELAATRDGILEEIKTIESKPESIAAELRAEVKKLHEEAKQILAEAKEEAEKVVLEQAILDKDRVEFKEELEDSVKKFAALDDEVSQALKDAKDSLSEAIKSKNKCEEIEKTSVVANNELGKLISFNKSQSEYLEEELKGCEEFKSELKAKLKAAAGLETDLKQKIQHNRDLISDNEKKSSYLTAAVKQTEDELAASKTEQDALIAKLKEQSNANSFRSKELDVGFDKLNRETKLLKREQKRVNAIKDEMSKKGA